MADKTFNLALFIEDMEPEELERWLPLIKEELERQGLEVLNMKMVSLAGPIPSSN